MSAQVAAVYLAIDQFRESHVRRISEVTGDGCCDDQQRAGDLKKEKQVPQGRPTFRLHMNVTMDSRGNGQLGSHAGQIGNGYADDEKTVKIGVLVENQADVSLRM